MTSETFEMTKKDVVDTPRDVILVGVVIDVKKTTWRNLVDESKLNKFENPDEEIISIKFQSKYDNKILKGEDTLRYYENPMCNSNLGRYLLKYDELKVGQTIKVEYNGDGFPSIKIK